MILAIGISSIGEDASASPTPSSPSEKGLHPSLLAFPIKPVQSPASPVQGAQILAPSIVSTLPAALRGLAARPPDPLLSDSSLTRLRAQLFYGQRDTIVGLVAIALLIIGARLGKPHPRQGRRSTAIPTTFIAWAEAEPLRLGENLLPSLSARILIAISSSPTSSFSQILHPSRPRRRGPRGDLELKRPLKTIPGVTTWTQLSLLVSAIGGSAGREPSRPGKLISVFHVVFRHPFHSRRPLVGTPSLIEGAVPFFLCALRAIATSFRARGRLLLRFFPLIVPALLLFTFTASNHCVPGRSTRTSAPACWSSVGAGSTPTTSRP